MENGIRDSDGIYRRKTINLKEKKDGSFGSDVAAGRREPGSAAQDAEGI